MLFAPRASSVLTPRVAGTWLAAFLGLFLIGAAWSLALPYDGPPDELQHVVRAYGAVDGQIVSPDGEQYAPLSLSPPDIGCFRWHPERSAGCAARAGSVPGSEHQYARTKTNAAFYSPAYYWLCGWPIYFWPDFKGIITARLLTAVFMAAVLACAFAVAASLRHGRRLLTGLLVTLSPVTLGLAGAVNPAGPEIAVAVTLWVALVAMVEAGRVNRWTVGLAGGSAAGLAVFRGFGLGWLFAILCVTALGLSREQLRASRLRALARNRLLWAGTGLAMVGVLFGLYWREAAPALDFDTGPAPSGVLSPTQVVAQTLWDRLPFYAQGMVGLTSYGNVAQPQIYFYVWYAAAGCAVLLGLACLDRRRRVQLAAIVLGSFFILAVPDVNAIRHGWYLSQGRYALPFIAGAPLLAGYLLGEAGILGDRRQAQLARFCAVLLVPFQFVALWFTMVRFDRGVQPDVFPMHLTPLHGKWTPPEGVLAPLALCVLGCVAVVGLYCWMTAPSASRGPAEPVAAEVGVSAEPSITPA
ncbi:MAG TPA: DUF2142 domain-containing protein [Actinocrinis sp.]|nr:DUF2142 domain-containing protein [Actinocrinis sp.]